MSEPEVSISTKQLEEIDEGLASPDEDTHWQAAIALGKFSETAPEIIWPLVEKWGSCRNEDTRTAISTCVLEHILEAHFDQFFGRIEQLIRQNNTAFADTFSGCWQFGQAELPGSCERFINLQVYAGWLWRSQKRKSKMKPSLTKQRSKREMRRERNCRKSGFARHKRFLTSINRFLNMKLAVTAFCTEFTKLWMQDRDATYTVLDAKKATWAQPYDELLIAAFQRGEMSGSEFEKEHAKLWGYEEDLAFQNMIDQIHSTCSVFMPSPRLEGEIDEEQLRHDVRKSLAEHQKLNQSTVQAASTS